VERAAAAGVVDDERDDRDSDISESPHEDPVAVLDNAGTSPGHNGQRNDSPDDVEELIAALFDGLPNPKRLADKTWTSSDESDTGSTAEALNAVTASARDTHGGSNSQNDADANMASPGNQTLSPDSMRAHSGDSSGGRGEGPSGVASNGTEGRTKGKALQSKG
jgi:hypothetical protein